MKLVWNRQIKLGSRSWSVDLMKSNVFIEVDAEFIIPLVWDLLALNCWIEIKREEEGFNIRFAKRPPEEISRIGDWTGESLKEYWRISGCQDLVDEVEFLDERLKDMSVLDVITF